MQLNATLFRNSVLFFVAFVAIVSWAFWPSFYSQPLSLKTTMHEVHGFIMTLWCLLLIAQPYAVRTNRRDVHRLIGKVSYLIAPLVVVTSIALMRYRLAHPAEGSGPPTLQLLGGVNIFIFAAFYGLAIYHRRQPLTHARWMVSTVFPLVPPVFDRLLFALFPTDAPFPAAIDIGGWIFADSILLGIALWDWWSHRRLDVFPAALATMVAYHCLVFWLGTLST